MSLLPSHLRITLIACCLFGMASLPAQKISEAEAHTFLKHYVGRWIGEYTVQTMAGDMLQRMDAEIIYTWEIGEKGRVLKGQAVYAAPNGVAYATSKSFFDKGFLVSIVQQNGGEKVYRGSLSADGNSVSWIPVERENDLDKSMKETFGQNEDGDETITTLGYENVTRNDVTAMMTIRGLLTRAPLEAPQGGQPMGY